MVKAVSYDEVVRWHRLSAMMRLKGGTGCYSE